MKSLRSRLTQALIPTRHPSWREFAASVGGEFRSNPFWRSDEVVTQFGTWTVHLDTVMLDPESGALRPGTFFSTRRGTQVWANFSSRDGFRFAIRDRQWLHRNPNRLEWDIDLGRLLDAARGRIGAQDVEVGRPAFDERFTIRTTEAEKLRMVVDESIVDRVMQRPDLAEIRIAAPDAGEPVVAQPASLIIWEWALLRDRGQLLDMHELVVAILDRMAALASASPPSEVEG